MGKKRSRMIDTSVPEEEVEVGLSRTKRTAERKDLQARLETLGKRLAKLPVERLQALDLDEVLEREVKLLATTKKGSGLARQRKRVAGLLRPLDLDELEAKLDRR